MILLLFSILVVQQIKYLVRILFINGNRIHWTSKCWQDFNNLSNVLVRFVSSGLAQKWQETGWKVRFFGIVLLIPWLSVRSAPCSKTSCVGVYFYDILCNAINSNEQKFSIHPRFVDSSIKTKIYRTLN